MLSYSSWRPVDIKILRFTFGVTLASALGYIIAWPLAFLTVLLTGKILMTDRSGLTLKDSVGLLLIVSVSVFAGFLISVAFVSYPVVFLLAITLAMFHIFYMARKGAPAVMVIMLLVGVTIIPLLALQSQALAYEAVKMLVFATACAVLFALISYALIPGGGNASDKAAPVSDKDAFSGAVKSVIVVLPLFIYIYVANVTSAILILIFVAILAQDTSLDKGLKSGIGILIGNLIGGVIGILLYNLLIMVPSPVFFVLLMALTWLIVGKQVFTPGMRGVLFGLAFPMVNVVLSGALGYFSDDASVTVYQRMFQLLMVTVYITLALSIVDVLSGYILGKEKTGVQAVR